MTKIPKFPKIPKNQNNQNNQSSKDSKDSKIYNQIMESLSTVVKEQLRKVYHIDEFIQLGFSIDELEKLDLKDRIEYCNKYLGEYNNDTLEYGPLGEGSSRIVYEIDDNTVIKLAHRSGGLRQNEHEVENYNIAKELDIQDILPKIITVADDYSYIIVERVLPIEAQDFINILGIPFDKNNSSHIGKIKQYSKYKVQRYKHPEVTVSSFINWIEDDVLCYGSNSENENDSMYMELMDENPWFAYLYKYVVSNRGYCDLIFENFGLAMRQGKPTIVILDSGGDTLRELY